jgi:DNA-binding transcriptional MerR regulator
MTVVLSLHFIRRAKKLAFSLREIGELISLEHDESASEAKVRETGTGLMCLI